jgi:hypothetical protein
MITPTTIELVAGLFILPILMAGAIYDVRSRTFPKHLWNSWFTKIAGVFTIMMYLTLVATQQWAAIMALLLTSIIFSVVFYVIALRFGSGGDYRALIYIVWVVPSFAVQIVIVSVVIGAMQVGFARLTKGSAAWAVGILIAFVIPLLSTALTW